MIHSHPIRLGLALFALANTPVAGHDPNSWLVRFPRAVKWPFTASEPALWAGLARGAYAVGYRQITIAGATVHVWYPAAEAGKPLLFGDYLADGRQPLKSFLIKTGVAPPTADSLLDSQLYASSSATPIATAVPLVLVAQGNGENAVDQVVLCEYVASHGFVVVTTPSPMLRKPLERENQIGEFAEAQASDLAATISRVATVVPVDTMRIGVIGHSFGARAALLLAMRNPRVRAVVSLDGGIGTATGVAEFQKAPSFRLNAQLPPLLHFFEELDDFMKPDFGPLKRLHTLTLSLEPTTGMHHVHFTTYGFAASLFPSIAIVTKANADTHASVVAVAERTLAFLQDHLVHESARTGR